MAERLLGTGIHELEKTEEPDHDLLQHIAKITTGLEVDCMTDPVYPVYVGTGSELVKYNVHLGQIKKHSDTIATSIEFNRKAALPLESKFPEENPTMFDHFITFMYNPNGSWWERRGTIASEGEHDHGDCFIVNEETKETPSYQPNDHSNGQLGVLLVELYALADRLCSTTFKKAVSTQLGRVLRRRTLPPCCMSRMIQIYNDRLPETEKDLTATHPLRHVPKNVEVICEYTGFKELRLTCPNTLFQVLTLWVAHQPRTNETFHNTFGKSWEDLLWKTLKSLEREDKNFRG